MKNILSVDQIELQEVKDKLDEILDYIKNGDKLPKLMRIKDVQEFLGCGRSSVELFRRQNINPLLMRKNGCGACIDQEDFLKWYDKEFKNKK